MVSPGGYSDVLEQEGWRRWSMTLDTVSAIVLLVIVSLTAYSISTDMQSNYVGCYLYFVVIRCSCAKADGADFYGISSETSK